MNGKTDSAKRLQLASTDIAQYSLSNHCWVHPELGQQRLTDSTDIVLIDMLEQPDTTEETPSLAYQSVLKEEASKRFEQYGIEMNNITRFAVKFFYNSLYGNWPFLAHVELSENNGKVVMSAADRLEETN